MKRVCGWCKELLGRKCPKCGSQKVNILIPGKMMGCAYCLSCGAMWGLAQEPETTGVCDSCRRAELAIPSNGEAERSSADDYQEYADEETRILQRQIEAKRTT